METDAVTTALGALAQASRLGIYRLLVQRGDDGACAGEIARQTAIAPATLSFHLAALRHAGLIECEARGRERVYRADLQAMHALVDYLTENCCEGRDCRPAATGPTAPSTAEHPQ